jgi:hypothetical protein
MRWLWEEHDRDAFRQLARGSLFFDAYGFTFEEAEAAYLEDAPWSYPRRWPCTAPRLEPVGEHRWSASVVPECDDVHTRMTNPYDWRDLGHPRLERTIDVVDGGLYNLTAVSGGVELLHCQLDPVFAEPPQAEESPLSHFDSVARESWDQEPTRLVTDSLWQLHLAAGTYEVVLYRTSVFDEQHDPHLEISPALVGPKR